MTTTSISPFLRRVLAADAIMSGACGLLLLLASGVLGAPLGLPEPLLRWVGVILLPFAAFVGYLAASGRAPRAAVWTIVIVNAAWVVDSVLLLLSGWIAPTTLGVAFILVQAAAVAILADLQVLGLRRSVPAIA